MNTTTVDKAQREHFRTKLLRLLQEAEVSQLQASKDMDMSQGTIADHISGRAYPKVQQLLVYRNYFSKRLRRQVTLYELTGHDDFYHIENMDQARLIEAIKRLPPEKKRAIETILGIDPEKEEGE